ncbi:phosphonate C-P lyase system protein PhnG [Labrys wisconsinensis]|uniref:Alpha-D-ribose 1-methylphosphonate 5-triphosphate synthase subunit PhnG n=1 Tax=Labrys wisconsinensis TaxID=425677 RepID=A0ABU0J9U6_9HYPH|nr:phosphonate C-P lyase system protein PhnG [Labrys wisconsinensis]MDQ0471040.1 alpha-D-ribose 1-methylphosphonate 5-triphosphate synthase subunit PhnG [Labrys wisconsinensis]
MSSVAIVMTRSEWMTILALSRPDDLDRHWAEFAPVPSFSWIRSPETGAVMVRGRANRGGALFGLGEMTVTRCSLAIEGGVVGLAYVAGRDRRHAAIAAMLDAVLQTTGEAHARAITVLADLQDRIRRRRERTAAAADATKVEFFMQVREES